MTQKLTPDLMLSAYASGVFPMSESREDEALFWVDPRNRGVFDLENFHISKRLARRIRQEPFQIRTDSAFSAVVKACAERPETWINAPLVGLYDQLFQMGHAHSVEVRDGKTLVGGVYGLAIGGAFFGESMFSQRTDASKIALAYLVDRLRVGGFTLFDTQFITPHLASLGAVEISRSEYHKRLEDALEIPADFNRQISTPDTYSILQRNTQTS